MRPSPWVISKAVLPPTAPRWICWCAAKPCPRSSRPCPLCPIAIAEKPNDQEFPMSEVRYTDQHEWIRLDGDEATVGITKHAAEALGDVVFVELPAGGKSVAAGGEAAVVESVKAASDVYAPASGTVTAAN